MKIVGKQSLIITLPLLILLSAVGLVTFTYVESDIEYKVDLTRINGDTVNIWGNVKLTITNQRDSEVGFTDINIELVNPATNHVFYSYKNVGGTLKSGESTSYNLEFKVLIADIPETDLQIKVTGWLLWNGERTFTTKIIQVPMSWEI